ncbi:MAG: hypothetical protein SNJ71_00620 [Bacteroidales bacterium]
MNCSLAFLLFLDTILLSSSDWKTREAATLRMESYGYPTVVYVSSIHSIVFHPEVRRRLKRIRDSHFSLPLYSEWPEFHTLFRCNELVMCFDGTVQIQNPYDLLFHIFHYYNISVRNDIDWDIIDVFYNSEECRRTTCQKACELAIYIGFPKYFLRKMIYRLQQ